MILCLKELAHCHTRIYYSLSEDSLLISIKLFNVHSFDLKMSLSKCILERYSDLRVQGTAALSVVLEG